MKTGYRDTSAFPLHFLANLQQFAVHNMSVSVVNNPNPWTSYDTYRDCSQGICSVYCSQWCYIVFPSPPPSFGLEDDGDPGSRTDFSPLIIGVIGILASAFILVSYYTIISKYCSRRRRRGDEETGLEFSENRDQTNQAEWQNNVGLDEALIKSITVCKYKRGDGFVVEGTDCSVCLSEFQEDESLRLLPKCNHAFHLPCIDAWLKSHSSCPLCRTNIASLPATGEANDQLHQTNVSVQQYQHRDEAAGGMLVLQDMESGGVMMMMSNEETFGSLVVDGDDGDDGDDDDDDEQELEVPKTTSDVSEDGVVPGLPIRRSVSLNSSSQCHQGPVSVADILSTNLEEEEEEIQLESIEKIINSRSRSRVMNLVKNSPLALKRSISTGRFIFTKYASKDGNSAVIPS